MNLFEVSGDVIVKAKYNAENKWMYITLMTPEGYADNGMVIPAKSMALSLSPTDRERLIKALYETK